MAAIEDAVVARLLADAGVAALVGARIYPMPAPERTPHPFITYQLISLTAERSLGGFSGQFVARLQLDAWGRTRQTVIAVGDAVFAALDEFRGLLGNLRVAACQQVTRGAMYEPSREHRETIDYVIRYDHA